MAESIEVSLTEEQRRKLADPPKVNPETYKAYLKGMSLIDQGTTASFEEGIAQFHKAINQDPTNSLAYASLALGYALRGHALIAPAESFKSAEAAANKALRIDPNSDEAYTALALLYLYKYWSKH